MQIIYTSGNYKRTIVKSIVAIVLGLVLVLWPTEVLNYTVKIIGAVFCVTGIISFLVSMRDQDERSARGLTSFNGIGSIILGILLWSMADFFTNMLMYLLGFILIVAGIGQLVMSHLLLLLGFMCLLTQLINLIMINQIRYPVKYCHSTEESYNSFFRRERISKNNQSGQQNNYRIHVTQRSDMPEFPRRRGGGEIEDAEYEEIE